MNCRPECPKVADFAIFASYIASILILKIPILIFGMWGSSIWPILTILSLTYITEKWDWLKKMGGLISWQLTVAASFCFHLNRVLTVILLRCPHKVVIGHKDPLKYTLPQKKCNFSESIFPGDPRSGSVAQDQECSQEWINHMITVLQSSPK